MPIKAPTPIAQIFHPHPIYSENIVLDTEDAHRRPRDGQVIVRAFDGFLFVKDGRMVYPSYDKFPDWWKDVEAYGYAAGLTGEYKYFIWAGQWDEDFEGKHIEVVRLQGLRGIVKESNRHWRGGMEEILWLETAQRKSYALLEPAEEYDRGQWQLVTASWTKLPSGESQTDPSFSRIDPDDDRPEWWKAPGNKAWKHFVKPLMEERKRRLAAQRKRAERARVEGQKSAREGKGRGEGGGIMEQEGSRTGPNTRNKRKRGPDAGNADAPESQKSRTGKHISPAPSADTNTVRTSSPIAVPSDSEENEDEQPGGSPAQKRAHEGKATYARASPTRPENTPSLRTKGDVHGVEKESDRPPPLPRPTTSLGADGEQSSESRLAPDTQMEPNQENEPGIEPIAAQSDASPSPAKQMGDVSTVDRTTPPAAIAAKPPVAPPTLSSNDPDRPILAATSSTDALHPDIVVPDPDQRAQPATTPSKAGPPDERHSVTSVGDIAESELDQRSSRHRRRSSRR